VAPEADHLLLLHAPAAQLPATFCVDISDTIDVKMQAVRCYESQGMGVEGGLGKMVTDIAAYFGTRINTAYAEPFYTHEMLGFGGLDQLV
jgi:LmbE family N-acetylglucosaminyl deacetylase